MTIEEARATSAGDAAAFAPGGDELIHGAAAAVVDGQLMPRRDQMLRHGLAHDAEPDKTNVFRHKRLFSFAPGNPENLEHPENPENLEPQPRGAIILMRGCI